MDALATLINHSRLSGDAKDSALLQVLSEVSNALVASGVRPSSGNFSQLAASMQGGAMLLGEAVVDCNVADTLTVIVEQPEYSVGGVIYSLLDYVVTEVHIRNNSASLAGMDDINFGGGTNAASPVWADAATGMEAVTGTDGLWIIRAAAGAQVLFGPGPAATRDLGCIIISETSVACTATFAAYGYYIPQTD